MRRDDCKTQEEYDQKITNAWWSIDQDKIRNIFDGWVRDMEECVELKGEWIHKHVK